MLYASRASPFISIQFFVLKLDGWFSVLSNKFIPLWYYFINLRSSIIFCISSYIFFFGYFFIMLICNSLWIILLWVFLNFRNFTVIRLSYCISNCITNQFTSCFCCFLNYSFRSSFKWICCRLFSMIKKFLTNLTTQVFVFILSKRQKSIAFTNIRSQSWTE